MSRSRRNRQRAAAELAAAKRDLPRDRRMLLLTANQRPTHIDRDGVIDGPNRGPRPYLLTARAGDNHTCLSCNQPIAEGCIYACTFNDATRTRCTYHFLCT